MATIVGSAYAKAAAHPQRPQELPVLSPHCRRQAGRKGLPRAAQGTQPRPRQEDLHPGRIAQIKAIRHAGQSQPDDLSVITQPVFVANGDHDLMVASSHSADMARRLPNAQLKIYPDSGHGGVFQHHQTFVPDALQFLAN